MRISIVHSFYRSRYPSGENAIVEHQVDILRRAGHKVQLICADSDEIELSASRAATLAWQVATHRGADPTIEMRSFRPDVVHVHNMYPNFGYEWLRRWPGPVVTTMHNFRPFCAQGSFFRSGAACMACLGTGGTVHSVAHRCYRGSAIATLPLALRNRRGVLGDPLLVRADRVVVLSDRAHGIYASQGVPVQKLRLIPNGLPDTKVCGAKKRREWLFVGRLSAEKGIMEALTAWPDEAETLVVVGDGPLRQRVEALAANKANVRVVGALEKSVVGIVMAEVHALLVPSLCFENLPTVVIEALRSGTPVLARRGNSVADFLDERTGETRPGLSYSSSVELREIVTTGDFGSLRMAARDNYAKYFSEEAWLSAFEELFLEVQYSREG